MAKICAVCGENLRSSSGENLCTLDYHLQHLTELNSKLKELFNWEEIPVFSVDVPTEIDFQNRPNNFPTDVINNATFPCALIGNLLHDYTEADLYVGLYSDVIDRKTFAEFWKDLNGKICGSIDDNMYKVESIENTITEKVVSGKTVLACEMEITCWIEEG